MAWTEVPPTDVTVGQDGHPELHNVVGRAVVELQGAVDGLPRPEVTKAQYDALAARVTALEAAGE